MTVARRWTVGADDRAAPWRASSILLVLFGGILVAIGGYFVFLRPALLPEDLRYIGLTQSQLETVALQLGSWLKQVFRVMGGYIAAGGVLTIALAATSFRARQPLAAAGALVGGLVSIGWMVVINFMIDSDFKWELSAVAAVWACAMAAYWLERGRRVH